MQLINRTLRGLQDPAIIIAGISKKLVTVFALTLDSCFTRPISSSFTNFVKPGFTKITTWCLAHWVNLMGKVPALVTGLSAPLTFSSHAPTVLANGRATVPKLHGITTCSLAVKKCNNHRIFAVINLYVLEIT
jgi:hypothetical protein